MTARTSRLLGAALFLLVIEAPLRADQDGVNPLGQSPEVTAAGRSIYNTSCTVCHGMDGTLGDRGPALAAARRYVRTTDAELFDAIRNGVAGTGMPAMGLNDDDCWRVVAYIRSLRARAADFPVEGNVEAGANLFWGQAGCGGCHMVQGRGGFLGPDLSEVGSRLSAKAIREALTEPRIKPSAGYESAVVRTKAGETIRGVVKNKHNFSVQLLGEDGRLRLLDSNEIESIDYDTKSLMPSDAERRLNSEEFRDLLAYVSRLAR